MHLPSSWKNLTLQTFDALDAIMKDSTLDNRTKDIKTLALLSGKSEVEIQGLPFKTQHIYLKKIQFLNDINSIKIRTGKRFILKGKRYRLILNANELTGGQYIDLMSFLKDPEAAVKNIHNIISVIATPLKYGMLQTPYNGKDHAARAKFFYENMPVSVAYPILVFFCNLSACLTPRIAAYLKSGLKQKMSEVQTRMQTSIVAMAGS